MPRRTDVERFWSKVDKQESCWLWTASLSHNGYGQFSVTRPDGRSRTLKAHRYAYELLVGPIPDGAVIDHLCRVRHCVNPDHLDPVEEPENRLRALRVQRQRMSEAVAGDLVTHCLYGHPFDEANTYRPPNGRQERKCRTCLRTREKLRYERTKARRNPAA